MKALISGIIMGLIIGVPVQLIRIYLPQIYYQNTILQIIGIFIGTVFIGILFHL